MSYTVKNYTQWNVEDVCGWLTSQGIPATSVSAFRDSHITGAGLSSLTRDKLMGAPYRLTYTAAEKLMSAITRLSNQPNAGSSSSFSRPAYVPRTGAGHQRPPSTNLMSTTGLMSMLGMPAGSGGSSSSASSRRYSQGAAQAPAPDLSTNVASAPAPAPAAAKPASPAPAAAKSPSPAPAAAKPSSPAPAAAEPAAKPSASFRAAQQPYVPKSLAPEPTPEPTTPKNVSPVVPDRYVPPPAAAVEKAAEEQRPTLPRTLSRQMIFQPETTSKSDGFMALMQQEQQRKERENMRLQEESARLENERLRRCLEQERREKEQLMKQRDMLERNRTLEMEKKRIELMIQEQQLLQERQMLAQNAQRVMQAQQQQQQPQPQQQYGQYYSSNSNRSSYSPFAYQPQRAVATPAHTSGGSMWNQAPQTAVIYRQTEPQVAAQPAAPAAAKNDSAALKLQQEADAMIADTLLGITNPQPPPPAKEETPVAPPPAAPAPDAGKKEDLMAEIADLTKDLTEMEEDPSGWTAQNTITPEAATESVGVTTPSRPPKDSLAPKQSRKQDDDLDLEFAPSWGTQNTITPQAAIESVEVSTPVRPPGDLDSLIDKPQSSSDVKPPPVTSSPPQPRKDVTVSPPPPEGAPQKSQEDKEQPPVAAMPKHQWTSFNINRRLDAPGGGGVPRRSMLMSQYSRGQRPLPKCVPEDQESLSYRVLVTRRRSCSVDSSKELFPEKSGCCITSLVSAAKLRVPGDDIRGKILSIGVPDDSLVHLIPFNGEAQFSRSSMAPSAAASAKAADEGEHHQAVAGSPPSASASREKLVQSVSKASSAMLVPEKNSKPRPLGLLQMRGTAANLMVGIRNTLQGTWDSSTTDYWSSRPFPTEKWNEEVVDDPRSLVDAACRKNGYHIESCWNAETHDLNVEQLGLSVRQAEDDNRFYKELFYGQPHETYICPEEPLVMSIQTLTNKAQANQCCRVIVRTKKEDKRVLVPYDKKMRLLKTLVPRLKEVKLTLVKKPTFADELLLYEEKQLPQRNYKFGVLYCKPYQNKENEIYGNLDEESSKPYQDFLTFLGAGERITLKGWDKYRAGLDVVSNNTGVHSVFYQYHEYQIMYHVATLLPNQPADEQKVERKRHIGNDVVTIVFKEQATVEDRFDPSILTSHFIHCVFVISPILDDDGNTTHYHLTVANKSGVAPYTPFIPESGADFPVCDFFREFLVVKMLNAERTAMASPEFQSLTTARKLYLQNLCTSALQAQK